MCSLSLQDTTKNNSHPNHKIYDDCLTVSIIYCSHFTKIAHSRPRNEEELGLGLESQL